MARGGDSHVYKLTVGDYDSLNVSLTRDVHNRTGLNPDAPVRGLVGAAMLQAAPCATATRAMLRQAPTRAVSKCTLADSASRSPPASKAPNDGGSERVSEGRAHARSARPL